jgi:alpha-galactosidase
MCPHILRVPDSISASTESANLVLQPDVSGAWENGGVRVVTDLDSDSAGASRLQVEVQSKAPLRWLQLFWRGSFSAGTRFLGDAWERGYGDLEWQSGSPERALPWYFLACDGENTAGYGVETRANALCQWKISAEGITLFLDVRCGGVGVELGQRTLFVAAIREVQSAQASPFAVSQDLCRLLCASPRLPKTPVYGGNDWYYAYGNNSRATILRDSQTIGELAPNIPNRPFMVIDDGWQESRHSRNGEPWPWNGGPWEQATAQFGDMKSVAREMKERGVRPGIWFRPLLSQLDVPQSWRFAPRAQNLAEGLPLDPSVPEVLDLVAADMRRFRDWGFELVKHDFSTYDIFWKWGFDFGDSPASSESWSFADKSRTTAEIIQSLYQTMREAAGDEMLLLGCNTIGHLGAGFFEIQRTGDDTSGREWERTRKMGVNTLAFRMAQHDAFFAVDADCVGLTNEIPWNLNRQWLDLLARSGTPLFVSADPNALGDAQKSALREAFALAATPQAVAEPLDWLDNICPTTWRFSEEIRSYNWFDTPDSL